VRIGNREGKPMAEHPNVTRIKDAYAAFAKGDLAVLEDLFAEDVLWHEGGRNQLTGEYRGREAVFGLFGKLMEVTEGPLQADLHAVLANDEHGVALVVATASRGDRSMTSNEAHVMHMRDGKVVEVWVAPTDQYALDEFFG
jgi:ketosteroid isomerase-like protein